MKTLTIITGASKGLGFELARQSLKAGDTVVTMERRPSKALVEEADKIGCNFIQFTADLLDRKGAVELLMWLLSDKEYAEHDRLILINNAGVSVRSARLKMLPRRLLLTASASTLKSRCC